MDMEIDKDNIKFIEENKLEYIERKINILDIKINEINHKLDNLYENFLIIFKKIDKLNQNFLN